MKLHDLIYHDRNVGNPIVDLFEKNTKQKYICGSDKVHLTSRPLRSESGKRTISAYYLCLRRFSA
jgi:hypothetical protein